MILGDDGCKKDLFDYDSLFDNGVGIQIKVGINEMSVTVTVTRVILEELTSQSYLTKEYLLLT